MLMKDFTQLLSFNEDRFGTEDVLTQIRTALCGTLVLATRTDFELDQL